MFELTKDVVGILVGIIFLSVPLLGLIALHKEEKDRDKEIDLWLEWHESDEYKNWRDNISTGTE